MNFERKEPISFSNWEPVSAKIGRSRGGANKLGARMGQICQLKPQEQGTLDHDRLAVLYQQLGRAGADAVINRAMEELAVRLEHSFKDYSANRLNDVRKSAGSMIALADQVGLCTLSLVAQAVTRCIDAHDSAALAATHERLIRIGAASLIEIWEQQGLSV